MIKKMERVGSPDNSTKEKENVEQDCVVQLSHMNRNILFGVHFICLVCSFCFLSSSKSVIIKLNYNT